MLTYVTLLCMGMMGVAAVLNVYRLVKGPDISDRVLALDTLYINVLAIIILFGIWLATDVFFEASLFIAVTGFVGTVALGKHMLHGEIID